MQVAANKRFLCTMIDATPEIRNEMYRPAGSVAPTVQIVGKELAMAKVEGRMCYNDMPYLLSSLLTTATPTTPATAINTRRWTFKPLNFAPDSFKTFTVEKGSTVGAERFTNAVFNALTMAFGETESSISGSMFGQQVQEQITITPSPTDIPAAPVNPKAVSVFLGTSFGTSEQQVLTVTGTATGGTFTLTYEGCTSVQATTPLPFGATAVQVQTALDSLFCLGAGNTLVTGGPFPATPITVTFQNTFAGVDASPIIATSLLTGTTPAIVVTTPVTASLTRLLRLDRAEVAIPERYQPGMTLDSNQPSYSYVVQKGVDPTAQIELMHDSQSAGFMTQFRAGQTAYLRILARGDIIDVTPSFSQWLKITCPVKFTKSDRSDKNNIYANTFGLALLYDAAFAGWIEVVVDTAIAAL